MTGHGHSVAESAPEVSEDSLRVARPGSTGPLYTFDRTLPLLGHVKFDIPRLPGQDYVSVVPRVLVNAIAAVVCSCRGRRLQCRLPLTLVRLPHPFALSDGGGD